MGDHAKACHRGNMRRTLDQPSRASAKFGLTCRMLRFEIDLPGVLTRWTSSFSQETWNKNVTNNPLSKKQLHHLSIAVTPQHNADKMRHEKSETHAGQCTPVNLRMTLVYSRAPRSEGASKHTQAPELQKPRPHESKMHHNPVALRRNTTCYGGLSGTPEILRHCGDMW